MSILQLSFFALLFFCAVFEISRAEANLIEWLREQGGYISDKLVFEVNDLEGFSFSSTHHAVLEKNVNVHELLFSVPADTFVKKSETNNLDAGENPFSLHLARLRKTSFSPAYWTEAGKDLLHRIDPELQFDAKNAKESAYLFQEYHVPLLDWIEHTSATQPNVFVTRFLDRVEVRAAKALEAGTVLQRRYFIGTTSELLETYGVVEEYPMRFLMKDYAFMIEEEFDESGLLTGELLIDWLESEPSFEEAEMFFLELKRLQDMSTQLEDLSGLPENEKRSLHEYHRALTLAATLAYVDITRDPVEPLPQQSDDYMGEKEDMVAWLRHSNGVLNFKVEIRAVESIGPQKFGLFATEDILPNELIVAVPKSLIVFEVDEQFDDSQLECGTANFIIDAILENDERMTPYISDLMEEQKGQLPALWTLEGKRLLGEVVGEPNVLPPRDLYDWLNEDWFKGCQGYEYTHHTQSAALVKQRSWFGRMVPVVDILRHGNGYAFNVDISFIFSTDRPIEVRATRHIQAGEELRLSRNFCKLCLDRVDGITTPDLFGYTGLVEHYPQIWDIETGFENVIEIQVDKKRDSSGQWSHETFEASVISEPSRFGHNDLVFLRGEYQRLTELSSLQLTLEEAGVRDYEFGMVKIYLEALRTALQSAVEAVDVSTGVECDLGDVSCAYSKLMMSFDGLEPEEDDVLELTTCDIEDMLSFSDWNVVDDIQSMYQRLTVSIHPDTNETCFDLDNTVQICTNYRPQYHELQVQYAAQFLEDIRRVAWIGGGDSMLAHELLKYPNLELAIGLELDQNVTRYSFKYFGAQPHWDNEKIEWWYGDASKSLLMLPDEYFNSFDLVIIDLSETVMSFKVTDQIDVLDAVALLMKPDGIFVKNEFYSEKMSQLFQYTLQYYRGDIPMICIQAMNLGSNSIDFLRKVDKGMFDHSVESFYVNSIDFSVEMMHDSIINRTALHLDCHLKGGFEKNTVEQQRSPGITMIIDVENLSGDTVAENLIQSMSEALSASKLNVLSSHLFLTEGIESFMITFEEGYLLSRVWPDKQYCALDLMLWSSFDKQNKARDLLIKSLGSSRSHSPSFRIVTGGMFGARTWQDDELKRGPSDDHQTCLTEEERQKTREMSTKGYGSSTESGLLAISLEKSLNVLNENDSPIFILCGSETSTCPTSRALSQHVTHRIHSIQGCSELSGLGDEMDAPSETVVRCTEDLRQKLRELSASQKIGGIIVDATVSKLMASIFLKICNNRWDLRKFFVESIFVLGVTEKEWMRTFVDRFRRNIIRYEPVFMAEYTIRQDSRLDLTLTSAGDPDFWKRISILQEELEAMGPSVEIRQITGGKVPFMADFEPQIEFPVSTYNATPPLEEWLSQEPLGVQVILQLEGIVEGSLDSTTLKEVTEEILDRVQIWDDLGEGFLCAGYFGDAWSTVLYDGRNHLDIGIFWSDEDFQRIQVMERMWLDRLEAQTVLRDIFPRGVGRVVNFETDIGERAIPHWAYPLTDASQTVIDAHRSQDRWPRVD